MNSIYSSNHTKFFDRIIVTKRNEMVNLINEYFKEEVFYDALDVGTTDDMDYESSNYLIKNLKNIRIYKSISDQKINSSFFLQSINKSIVSNFSKSEIDQYKVDLVISNATIEHVGNYTNQLKMISNIIDLTKKNFVITTPNRFHPIDFHTKIPLIHWLSKKIHRNILSIFGLNYFAKEENLNLLSLTDLKKLLNDFKLIDYKIFHIRLFGFISNYIIIGKKLNSNK
jgi:hypothetical protein